MTEPKITISKHKYTQAEYKQYLRLRQEWKLDDDQDDILVGQYHLDEKNDIYVIDDVRITTFQPVDLFGNEDIVISLDRPLNGKKLDQYFLFHWYLRLDGNEKIQICINNAFPLEAIEPEKLVDSLYNVWAHSGYEIAGQMMKNMEMISSQLTSSSEGTFIYELLQNANDYPIYTSKDKPLPVTVEFRLVGDYLVFRHSGEYFSPRNVAAICKVHDGEKEKKRNAIGYKGIGFKTVFTGSDVVYLRSGKYQFRFSHKEAKSTKDPWQIMPIWTTDDDLPIGIRNLFLSDDDNFRVQVALHSQERDKFVKSDKKTKLELLQDLFKDLESIVFVPNVEEVRVFDEDKLIYNPKKDDNCWLLSKPLKYNFTEEEKAQINSEISSRNQIPEKYKDLEYTIVSFACKRNSNRLEPVDNAKVYCYLPTEISFGFSFMFNTDMIPNGQRTDIERGLDFNNRIAKIAGTKFFEWIQSLLKSGEYEPSSVFSLIPDFKSIIDNCTDDNHKQLISNFRDGFEECLESGKEFIPVERQGKGFKLCPITGILIDKTGLTTEDVMTDKDFVSFSDTKHTLPIQELRKDMYFNKFVKNYSDSFEKFDKDELYKFFNQKEFNDWLLNSNNNKRWFKFICKFDAEALNKYAMCLAVGIMDKLYKANELYFNIDNVIRYLGEFSPLLPRLRREIRTVIEEKQQEEIKVYFSEFKEQQFFEDVLFCGDQLINTQQMLSNKKYSINFIKYLTTLENPDSKLSTILFDKVPLFDQDGTIIKPLDSNNSTFFNRETRTLFFNSELVTEIRGKAWFKGDNIHVVSDDYLTQIDKGKDIFATYGAKDLSLSFLINECINTCPINIEDSIELSKDLIGYLYKNKKFVNPVIEKDGNGNEVRNYSIFNGIPLFFTDGTGKSSLSSANEDDTFLSVDDKYYNFTWSKQYWVREVSNLYFDGSIGNEELRNFFNKYFGLHKLTDGRFRGIIRKHIKEIYVSISEKENIDSNVSFWNFMSGLTWNENTRDAEAFTSMPILLENGELSTNWKDDKHKYLYNDELQMICEKSWMPEDVLTVLSSKYGNDTNVSKMFSFFGFKEYDESRFADFFETIILGQEKPKEKTDDITATTFNVNLDTLEQCRDFHNFMSTKTQYLDEINKSLLKGAPVYVLSSNGSVKTDISTGHYIPKDNNFGIKSISEKNIIPSIDLIDSEFITDQNLSYWEDVLDNKIFDGLNLCEWLSSESGTINDKISSRDNNIMFWRWIHSLGLTTKDNISKLRNLNVLTFSKDDTGNVVNVDVQKSIADDVYLSDYYMGKAGIERFAAKHGKVFISSAYIHSDDDIESWLKFWKGIGVKDNIKSVIRSIIDKDLETLEDRDFPSVLVQQYSTEIANPETWAKIALKLINLKVETTTANVFVAIKDALRITVDDYSIKEPFKGIKLPNEISRAYYEDENVKNLINKIADYSDKLKGTSNKISELQQWRNAKVHQYVLLQDEFEDDTIPEAHISFIKALVEDSNADSLGELRSIKLYSKKFKLVEAKNLCLGTIYSPRCDFEKFGIDKEYVNDSYAKLGDIAKCRLLLNKIGCDNKFNNDDFKYLNNKDFSIYFWCQYIPNGIKLSPLFKDSVNKWVADGKFDNIACIPSDMGNMKKPSELYQISLNDYVPKIPDGKDKVMDQRMNLSEPLRALMDKDAMSSLTVQDSIDYLASSKPKDVRRANVLTWLYDSEDENKEVLIETYKKSPDALWINGQGKASALSELMVIDPDHCKQAYVFNSSEKVIDLKYFPTENALEIARDLFGMDIISDDSLEPTPQIYEDETINVSSEVIRRLLLVIAFRYKDSWKENFDEMVNKVKTLHFWLCDSISYGYKSLSIDNEDFYFDKRTNNFYYVDGWQDKKVYESFVNALVSYVNDELDIRECKVRLDENFQGAKVAKYLNQNCNGLFSDKDFLATLDKYWSDIYAELDLATDEEPEMEDSSNTPKHIEPYYYNDGNISEAIEDNNEDNEKGDQTPDNKGSNHSFSSSDGESPKNTSTSTSSEPRSINRNSPNLNGLQSYGDRHEGGYNMPKPHVFSSEENERLRTHGEIHTLGSLEPTATEINAISNIVEGLTPEQISDSNYIAQSRLYDNMQKYNLVPEESREDFIRHANRQEHKIKGGKYIHKCSAFGGIMYISPSIWRRVSDDKCIIVVYYGPHANEFKYFDNKEKLLQWIGEDDLVIKLTGDKKVNVIDELYSNILRDAKGTAYTLVRIASNTKYNSVFAKLTKDITNVVDEDEHDY